MKNEKDNAVKATVTDLPRQTYYFYAYQFIEGGMWYTTTLARSVEEAKHSLSFITKTTVQQKLCFVCL
jgi:hypothetical protein